LLVAAVSDTDGLPAIVQAAGDDADGLDEAESAALIVSEGERLRFRHPAAQACVAIVSRMVNDPFKALAHPIRRGIVERLAAGPATVGRATGGFGVSKPAISRHLKVLEDTGVVKRVVEGRTHRLSLEPAGLTAAADWMESQRVLWGRLFDVVEEYLKEEESP
jgi:DNA-binding transcriptional ArsR family regulator